MRNIPAILGLLALLAWLAVTFREEPADCRTDTECMEMHGGNGDPEPRD